MNVDDLSRFDSAEVSDETIVPVMNQLAAIQSALAARLLARDAKPANGEDQLLTIDQAASKLKTSKYWLYRNSQKLPFVVRIGKNLRFSENGIELWIRTGQGTDPHAR